MVKDEFLRLIIRHTEHLVIDVTQLTSKEMCRVTENHFKEFSRFDEIDGICLELKIITSECKLHHCPVHLH